MKIYKEGIQDFEPWSGAVSTYSRLSDADMLDAFEAVLDDLYPDGMSETELNDLLWFEADWCFESVGLRTISQIDEEIEELEEQIEELEEQISELDQELEDGDIDEDDYNSQVEDIRQEIEDKEDEISLLKEERCNAE